MKLADILFRIECFKQTEHGVRKTSSVIVNALEVFDEVDLRLDCAKYAERVTGLAHWIETKAIN